MMTRFLIADNKTLERTGIRVTLTERAAFMCIGECKTWKQATQACESYNPDLLLLDLEIPGLHSLDAVKQLQVKFCNLKIIGIFSRCDQHEFQTLRKSGVSACILRNESPERILYTIREIIHEGKDINLDTAIEISAPTEGVLAAEFYLTSREYEVLSLIAKGMKDQEIGGRLYLSRSTIRSHIQRILEKLGSSNRTQAIYEAQKRGILIDSNMASNYHKGMIG